MKKRLRSGLLLSTIVLVGILFTGCDSDSSVAYSDQVWDDIGEEDIELREQLASRRENAPRAEISGTRYAQSRHPYQVGEMDLDDEEYEAPVVRKPSAFKPRKQAARSARERIVLRPVPAAPAPAPAPEYWAHIVVTPKHHHGHQVGEMEIE